MLAENDAPSFILVNAIFLLGTFTFAIVLGVVSDDIGNELKAIRSGNYPVLIKDHGDLTLPSWHVPAGSMLPLMRSLLGLEACVKAHANGEVPLVLDTSPRCAAGFICTLI